MINLKSPQNKISWYLLFSINFLKGILFTFFNKEFIINDIKINYPKNLMPLNQRSLFYDRTYEEEEYRLCQKYIHKNDIVIELGGCIGFISCVINKKLKNQLSHVVLEPNPKLIKYLEQNKEKNKCSFLIENKIISNKKEEKLYLNHTILGSSITKESKDYIVVEGVKIKELELKHSLTFNTLILDIEGAEYDFFKNIDFEQFKFEKIIVEFHNFANILSNEDVSYCKEKLYRAGFYCNEKIKHTEVWLKKNSKR